MPILLREFIQQKTGQTQLPILDTLLEDMKLHAPGVLDTQSSKYFYSHYKGQIANNRQPISFAMGMIAEKALLNINLRQPSSGLFWDGYPTEKKDAITIHAIFQAAIFEVSYGTGNCSMRSAYAAIKLFPIFKDSAISLAWKSCAQRNHVVLYIGNKDMGWMIYDPLTNPELIFRFEEYQQEVLPLIPKVATPKMDFSLKISSLICEKYSHKLAPIKELFCSNTRAMTIESLLTDPVYVSALIREKIPASKHHSITRAALEYLKSHITSPTSEIQKTGMVNALDKH